MSAVLEAPARLTLADLRAETGFAWSCRTAEVEYGRVVRACEVSGSDRAEYAAHHKSHGRAPLKSAYQRTKPWAAPRPVKVHAPKPMDAGERCEWTSKPHGGHYENPGGWEGEPYTSRYTAPSGAFIHDAAETRTGTVWSVATSATEWWVLPDDDPGHPVLVKRHGKKFSSEYREGELYEVAGYAERARLNVLRAELVRRRGIYAVVDCVTENGSWGYRSGKTTYVKWHSDQACPAADGKERYDRESHGHACGYAADEYGTQAWSPIAVAVALTSGRQAPSELCAQCITDVDPEAPEVPTETPAGDAPETETAPDGDDDSMGALRVITVESGGHSAVYTVGDGWDETAAHADMLGPGGTIRVLWGGRELTPGLCAQVREAVRAYRDSFDPAAGISPDDTTWRILCERSTPDKRREYALMCAERVRDDALRAARERYAADVAAAGDELALQRAAGQYESEARFMAGEAYRRVCADIERTYQAETQAAS